MLWYFLLAKHLDTVPLSQKKKKVPLTYVFKIFHIHTHLRVVVEVVVECTGAVVVICLLLFCSVFMCT